MAKDFDGFLKLKKPDYKEPKYNKAETPSKEKKVPYYSPTKLKINKVRNR